MLITDFADRPSIYIETSVVSYLRPEPASQVIAAARQILTRRWWDSERSNYQLVTSQYVLDEASHGKPALVAKRLDHLQDIPLLSLGGEILIIAEEILARAILPRKAQYDAFHIAVAAYHDIDYLLTWNCTHIANARILPRIEALLDDFDYPVPIICTPEEMVDDETRADWDD